MGLHTLTAAANVALALSIFAVTASSLRNGQRPSHGRSWLFFAAASTTLVLHAVLDALGPGFPSDVASLLEVTTTAFLAAGFVYLYGADREELHRLQTAAERDPMTQLYNVRTFRVLAAARLEAVGQDGLGIVVLDLDGLKQLNDTRGHPAGDRALRLVATAVRASMRGSDIAARYGGDEFLLLLDGCDDDAAARIVHRIRNTVQALSTGAGEPISFSAGIASSPALGRDLDELIRKADDALIAAKRAGKNDLRHALTPDRA